MKPLLVSFALIVAAACGSEPVVVVQASLDEAGATRTLEGLPVRLLPYDRDDIFDSLAGQTDEPEPAFSPELLQQLSRIDSLEQAEPAGSDSLRAANLAFRRAVLAQVDSVRAARAAWAETAYRGFDEAVAERIEEAGRQEVVDTTGAGGVARIAAAPGKWWLYARYALPRYELYWNVPVEFTGDSTVVRLTRANAEVRPLF